MKHDQLTAGQDYWASGKPATDLTHYGVQRVRVLETERWTGPSHSYSYRTSTTAVEANGKVVNVSGKRDAADQRVAGQYVLVERLNDDGTTMEDRYGSPVHLVHMAQLRGLWSELEPKRAAILQERADRQAEKSTALAQAKARAERIRLGLEGNLGRSVVTELRPGGWIAVTPDTLEDILDLVKTLLDVADRAQL